MIQAIFFDIDGTLVSFNTHTIPPSTLSALRALRAKGIKLFLSTGRHKSMISPVRALFPFDGCITLNGQYCFCADQVLRKMPMCREDVEQLVALTREGDFSCIFLEEEDSYINLINDHSQVFPRLLSVPLPPLADPIRALNGELYQAVLFLSQGEQHLLTDRTRQLTAMRWHPEFIDVIASGGGKDKGMDAILAHLGIPLEHTMAFGDGENDLPMLRHAAIGVAMGNADQTVRAQADYVTSCVDEDGIPRALAHFGLL